MSKTLAGKVIYATGRRKTSTARVFMKSGSGQLSINGRPLDEYMHTSSAKLAVKQALDLTNSGNAVDLKIFVRGGGESGQAGAIRHGISRALVTFNETLKPEIKKAGFLTRDSRMVERKKYGLRGARRATQYSKR